jgi:hypothetical protein
MDVLVVVDAHFDQGVVEFCAGEGAADKRLVLLFKPVSMAGPYVPPLTALANVDRRSLTSLRAAAYPSACPKRAPPQPKPPTRDRGTSHPVIKKLLLNLL